jgi:hypothetical protein
MKTHQINTKTTIDDILQEVTEKFGEGYVYSNEYGYIFLKDPKGFEPTPISDDEEIPEGTIVKIMPNWLDKGENPDSTYFAMEDRGDRLLVWYPSKLSAFGGRCNEWAKKTMYLPANTK